MENLNSSHLYIADDAFTFDPLALANGSLWFGGPGNDSRPPPPPPPPPGPNYAQPKSIHFVCLGIIIPLGFFFNVLSFVVFATCRSLRNTTTGHYLLALALADFLFLVGEFIRWLNTPNMTHLNHYVDFMDRIDWICKFVYWLRYAAKLASAWITVVITIERFTTVAFPLKVIRWSTTKIAKGAITIVYMLSIMGGLFPIWTVGVQEFDGVFMCIINGRLVHVYNICSWVFLRVGSLLLPGALIVVFCALIIAFLGKAKNIRQRKLSTTSNTSHGSRKPSRTMERQLTMMLLAVAIAFIVLRLPYTIIYYLHLYKNNIFGPEIDIQTSYRIFYALKMSDIFVSVNYAINFFLYCWCGSSFRKQLKFLFSAKKRTLGRRPSAETASSVLSSRNGSLKSDYGRQVELCKVSTVNGGKFISGARYADRKL